MRAEYCQSTSYIEEKLLYESQCTMNIFESEVLLLALFERVGLAVQPGLTWNAQRSRSCCLPILFFLMHASI